MRPGDLRLLLRTDSRQWREATLCSRLSRIKKKIEADINELEMALDHANKANAEAMKQVGGSHGFFFALGHHMCSKLQ